MEVVTNGFDTADLPDVPTPPRTDHFELLHLGSLNKDRNPGDLWAALRQCTTTDPLLARKLRITLVGKVDREVLQSIEKEGLTGYLQRVPYLPHSEIFPRLQAASVLLLPLNNVPAIEGIITGKIFEYLAARRPVLCIGSSTGDAARIIDSAGAGKAVGFGQREKLKEIIHVYFNDFRKGQLEIHASGIEQYSREKLTKILVAVLDTLTEKKD